MLETKRDVRFGVIGCGNIARAHMEALKNGEGVVCAGVCDSSHDLFNISLDVCGGILEVIVHDVVRVKAILRSLRGLLSIVDDEELI